MENAENVLKLADVKTQNLQKMMDQLEAQASTAMLCTLQWKDIEGDLVTVKNFLMKQAEALVLRERRVMEMKETVDRRVQELETVDRRVQELEMKMLDTCCEIDSKKKELDGVEKSLQESKEQFDLKQRKHKEIEKSIDLEQKRLDSIRVLVQESETDLEDKEKLIKQHTQELNMKLIEFTSVDTCIKARSEDLEKKERELNAITKSIEDQCALFRSKEKELASLQVSIEECKKGHEALNEQGGSIQFPRAVASAPTSRSAGNLPGTSFVPEQVKIERQEPVMDPSNHVSSNDQSEDATMASLPTDYHVPGYHLMRHDVLSAFQLSKDQPNFVLCSMLEYYSEDTGFDESVVSNIVLLLEKLMEVSPKITPDLRKEASKLALSWKTRIRLTADCMMQVLAFMLFLAVYGLAPYFGREEIITFGGAVAHQKQAPEICQALGFGDKTIHVFIKNITARKQYMEAARLSCALGLIKKFPPQDFFERHMKNAALDAMHARQHSPEAKAIDKQISAMKSVLKCVADYKINAAPLVRDLTQQITEKEKEKEKLQAPARPMVRPGEDGPSSGNKRRR